MLTTSFKRKVIFIFLTFFLIFIIPLLQLRLDQIKGNISKAEELELLPKPEVVRLMSLGYNQLVSDILWLRVIQYIGEMIQTEKGWQWFIHTLEIINFIDPQFEY